MQDMRKERGLSPQDSINLAVSSLQNLGDVSALKSTCKISELKEDINVKGQSVELSSGVINFIII